MNATSLDELRGAAAPRAMNDERLEQVRQLLLGDHIQSSEARIAALEARLRELEDARLKELETNVARSLDALSARLDALGGELSADQRASFNELARSVLELGERIQRISGP